MTDFLFAKQSFIRGVGSIGNIGGVILVNDSSTANEADTKAIRADWQMVGEDMREAINAYAQ